MRLRRATAADAGFLRQMIVQAAFPPDRIPPFAEAVRAPQVVPWIEGWMRGGDVGVVAGTEWERRCSRPSRRKRAPTVFGR